MANPIQINGTHERAEQYASAIVKLMRPALKIRNTFSRDYEGDAKTGAIKIPVRTLDPTIREYDVKNGLAPSQSATSYIDAVLDKTYAINELIDGFEAQAVPDNLVAQRLEAGAYAISKQLEGEAIDILLTGTKSTNTTASTEKTIYANIVKEIANLSKKGVDKNRMYVAISYDTEVMLLTDEKYSNTASQIGAELARDGVVGRINGVNVITEDLKGAEFIVYGVDWVQTADVFKSNPRVVDLNGSSNYVDASALKARFGSLTLLTNKDAVIVKESTTVTKYTVTYNANGGTGSVDAVEVTAGESITLSDGTGLTSPENKVFKGWAKSSSAQNPTVNSPFTPDADVTLYAVYGDE